MWRAGIPALLAHQRRAETSHAKPSEDAMTPYICVTCGVQAQESEEPPAQCPICEDERQYVGWGGQRWAAPAALVERGRRNDLREEEPGLVSIGTTPQIAIGQRALLVRTPAGNVLWDCLSFLD